MPYDTRYISQFNSIRGDEVIVYLDKLDYAGDYDYVQTAVEQPVLIERQGDVSAIGGVYGTACVVRLMNDGTFDVAEFVANNYNEWRCTVTVNGNTKFIGYIVVDDITNEYRVTPYAVELTFTDNLALLSDIEAPFEITDQFTPIIEMIEPILAQTGLDLPINVFFAPYPDGDDPNVGTFEQVQLIPRSYAASLTTWQKSKGVLQKILTPLHCRIFQQDGEWYIIRVTDRLYNTTTLNGWKYVSGVPEAATLDVAAITSLVPLRFSQTVTHKRSLKSVTNTYKYDAGFQLINADLQEVGAVQSTTTDGPNTITRYDVSFWDNVNGQTSYIEVVTDTATGAEVDRKLVLPFVSSDPTQVGAAFLRSQPILVSEDDRCLCSCSYAGSANSNFQSRFYVQMALRGVSGQWYLPGWAPVGDIITPDDIYSDRFYPRAGGDTDVDYRSAGPGPVYLDIGANGNPNFTLVDPPVYEPFPEDGQLYFCLFGFNNSLSRRADLDAFIKDLQIDYRFYVNESLQINGQEHKASQTIDSLNEVAEQIYTDDSPKYNTIGTLYKSDDTNTEQWYRFDGDTETQPIGKLAAIEQMIIQGESRKVYQGEWEGTCDFANYVDIAGAVHVPSRLTIDPHRRTVQAEFVELSELDSDGIDYRFKFLYGKMG